MAKIAFILLCHKDPEAIIQQAKRLTAAGDYMSIHFALRADPRHFEMIQTALAGNPNVAFPHKRIKCGWGAWSLVQATLYAVEAAVDAFPRATHFYMLSGDCMAIKSAEHAHDFLDANDYDYIESFDYLIYRHFFNERTHKNLFYFSSNLQRRLGLKRDIPADLQMQIGSQWWCLRRRTIEWIIDFTRERKDVMRFFRTTWIPDETFFQTVVRHLVPEKEIQTRTLTFLMFSDYGMPVTFYNDHYDLLLSQDFLFARKISPEAKSLKRRLGDLYAEKGRSFMISNEGVGLFKFLTQRGRIGRRFGTRFWETEATLGRDREMLIIVCKKWHVAKRLVEAIRQKTDIPAVDYVFNEEDSPLPDLGGIQSTLSKRHRHRRALMRMLFEYFTTKRLIICIDPGNFYLLEDFGSDRSSTRILEIECEFTDEFLTGHAKRIGLAGDQTREETMERLLPTIRNEFAFERERLLEAKFDSLFHFKERHSAEENIATLVKFLEVSPKVAKTLLETPHLFDD